VTSSGKPFLERYYEACVIGGWGSFSIVVNDISRFQDAVRRKLLTEIAEREILATPVSFVPAGAAGVDCTVQEGSLPLTHNPSDPHSRMMVSRSGRHNDMLSIAEVHGGSSDVFAGADRTCVASLL
jgi:Protein of unknown function (DUF1194)